MVKEETVHAAFLHRFVHIQQENNDDINEVGDNKLLLNLRTQVS